MRHSKSIAKVDVEKSAVVVTKREDVEGSAVVDAVVGPSVDVSGVSVAVVLVVVEEEVVVVVVDVVELGSVVVVVIFE